MTAESLDRVIKVNRGLPLVATRARWALFAALACGAMCTLGYGYISFSHSERTFESLTPWLASGAAAVALITFAMLRAEESRLARELRTARTGTTLIRDMVVRRRQRLPIFLRLGTTTLGTAAVLLADGDRSAALDALAANSPLMGTGRLRRLREVIEADADRASSSMAGLARCIDTLRTGARIGNAEADRYRTHVLVKAVLQQADADVGTQILEELAHAKDEEERVYAVWLRVWFDLGRAESLTEGELRIAALLARTHGADDLVKKLDERIAQIATAAPPPSAPPTGS